MGSVRIEGCPECGGAWFDRGELNDIAKQDVSALNEVDAAFPASGRERALPGRDLRCPVCLAILEPFEFKHFLGVILDGCAKCKGLWVDDGELTLIADRIRSKP